MCCHPTHPPSSLQLVPNSAHHPRHASPSSSSSSASCPPSLLQDRTFPFCSQDTAYTAPQNSMAESLRIAHITSADVQMLERPLFHIACVTRCPSPTAPQSGPCPSLEGLRLYIGSLRFPL